MNDYTIKEVSKMFHLPPSTLRYYEDMGILTKVSRTPSGQRIYTDMHIHRLRTICCFKNTGMTISQLQQFFSYENAEINHIDSILSLLNDQKISIEEKIEQLKHSHTHLLRKLKYYEDIKRCTETSQEFPKWEDYKYMEL